VWVGRVGGEEMDDVCLRTVKYLRCAKYNTSNFWKWGREHVGLSGDTKSVGVISCITLIF